MGSEVSRLKYYDGRPIPPELSPKSYGALFRSGYETEMQIALAPDEQLLSLYGVGPLVISEVRALRIRMRTEQLTRPPYWPLVC